MTIYMIFYAVTVLFFLCGPLMHYIAQERGGNSINRILWAAMGFYMGPLALPLIFFTKKKTKPNFF